MFHVLVNSIPLRLRIQRIGFRSVVCGCCLGLFSLTTTQLSGQNSRLQPPKPKAVDPTPPAEPTSPSPPAPTTPSAPTTPAGTPAPGAPAPGAIPDGLVIPLAVAAPAAEVTPAAIEQTQPPFFVHADTAPTCREFYDGEQINLTIRCEVDAFIYVLYTQADGLTYVVLPNSGSSVNKVPAKQEVRIPGAKDSFRWTVSAPFGKERVKVIASSVRIPGLENPEMRKKHATQIGQKQIEELVKEILSGTPKDQWSEVSFEITTIAGSKPQSPVVPKRYGLFFGVPFQLSTSIVAKVTNEPARLSQNLGLPTITDGILLQNAFKTANGLDESAVFPNPASADIQEFFNSLASRERIKWGITELLPKVTKAGDTVVIYFSGHGSTFTDPRKNGAKQSYIVPCDAIDFETLFVLWSLNQEGKLKENEFASQMLTRAENILADENINLNEIQGNKWNKMSAQEKTDFVSKVERLLIEKTAITSDEFSHWIQALAHCRVVVILDACMSGGFAPETAAIQTKAISLSATMKNGSNPGDFQFFRPQMERLKSLGDTNTALLAAARIDESSLQAVVGEEEPATSLLSEAITLVGGNKVLTNFFSVNEFPPLAPRRAGIFTYFVVQALLTTKGPVTLETAAEESNLGMKRLFDSELFRARHERVNEERKKQGKPPVPLQTHHPVYFDHCEPKTVLKP